VTDKTTEEGLEDRILSEHEMREVLWELRDRGSLISIDPNTGKRVDVDIAIERDCGPRSGT
jgi:hypothetical protein